MTSQLNANLQFRFFLPGRIIFMIQCDAHLKPEDLQATLYQHLNRYLKPILKPILNVSDDQTPIAWDESSFVEVRDVNKENLTTVFLAGSIGILVDDDYSKQRALDKTFVELIDALNEKSLGLLIAEGYTIQAVTPDWLMSGAPGNVGTGGPGARPIPVKTAIREEYKFKTVPNFFSGEKPLEKGDTTGVDIVILDTAPKLVDLKKAQKDLKSTNELLDKLLFTSNGRENPDHFEIEYLDSPTLQTLSDDVRGYQPCGHGYKMTDHGLFVAGIIHSIAPEANLHLVRVLGDYGVGSLSSILVGFNTVFNLIDNGEAKNSTVLVNMSLTLNSPLPEDFACDHIEWPNLEASLNLMMDWHKFERATQSVLRSFLPMNGANALLDMIDPARIAGRALLGTFDYLLRLVQPLLFVCDAAESKGIRMVAAAGNDSVGLANRLPARYPAAYQSVIGVGALQKNMAIAPYSDESDQPLSAGILAFGGGIGPVKADECGCEVADSVDGVLGLYIGNFPDGSPSKNGWAEWSGTSFAAPVVTGTIARHCLRGADANGVKAALMSTGSAEHIMLSSQG